METIVRLSPKVGRYLRMGWKERLLLLEAALFLALARAAILAIPFRRIVPWLQRAPEQMGSDADTIAAVRRAVMTAARHVPWNAVCLPQAMACKAMLARRGQGSALHVGAGLQDGKGLMAHAWLVAGGEVVVGEESIGDVTPLTRFG
jgi:Transglutaminase-like superfamily